MLIWRQTRSWMQFRCSGLQPGHLWRLTRRRRAGDFSRHRCDTTGLQRHLQRVPAHQEVYRRSSTRGCITYRPPVRRPLRRLDPAKLAAAKAEFSKLEKDGIIRRSSSNWSAPLHMAMKPDRTWRSCGDYRRLNLATTLDSYSLHNIQDLSSRLHGCSIFSKLDLMKGYYQIPVQERDIHKTLITPFGLWELSRMPFRLRNASQSFQRFMDVVLSGLDFTFCYLDDILIGSSSTEEHLHHLQLVLQRLQEYGLVLNMEKCELARQEIDFLGHHITAEGSSLILKHLQTIQDFPAPQDKKQLQSFLGMVFFIGSLSQQRRTSSFPSRTRCRQTGAGLGHPPCSTASS